MKIIIQFGLKRSGNHGISNLILKSNNNFVHLNDLNDLDYNTFKNFLEKEGNLSIVDNVWTGLKKCQKVLISLENKSVISLKKNITDFSQERNIRFIILLRNPYNNMASLYKYFLEKKIKTGLILLTQCIQLWKEYCNYILQSNNNCISIIYDKFYSDVQYRREIFDILKINYNEKYVNEINGWGKTFFDLKANTTKNQDIFKRYLNFKNDKKFIDYVFKDIELIELWNKICEKFKINKDKQLIKIIYKYIA